MLLGKEAGEMFGPCRYRLVTGTITARWTANEYRLVPLGTTEYKFDELLQGMD